jgi:two-component system response regulator YesN
LGQEVRMKHLKSSSLLISLVLVSCIIGIIPLLLLGYLSYNKSASIVLEEVTAGNRLFLQQNKVQAESYLKTIDTLATQTIGGPVTTNAVSMSTVLDLPHEYAHIKMFESMISKLLQIQVYELGIKDVQLISFRQNWIVDGGSVYSMEDRSTDNEMNKYLHRLKAKLAEYRDDQKRSYWTLVQEGQAGYVLKLIKHIPLNSNDPYGLVTVNIPLTEISSRLTGGGQLGLVTLVDSAGMILSHPDADQIGVNVSETPYYKELLSHHQPEGYFTHQIGDVNYTVIYNRSKYNDWTYVSLTPLESLSEKSQIIKTYTLILIGIIIVLIVIASLIVSFKIYSPIRRIYWFIKPDKLQYKGNELQYIGDQVKVMAQSQTRMVDEIKSLNRQARTLFVIHLLQGEIKSEEWEESFEKFGFPVNWDQWCLIALQIDTFEETHYSEKDRDLLIFAIQNMVEEIIPAESRLCPVVQNKCLVLIIGTPMDDSKPLKVQVFNYAESIQQSVRSFLKLKVSIGISRTYSKFHGAPMAHQESLEALTYRIRLGQELILFIDEVQPEKQDHFRYPRDLEFRVMEAVRQLDIEQARESLERIILHFFEKHVNHNDYQIFLSRLFNNLTGMVQDAGVSVQDVFHKDIFMSDIMLSMHSPQKIRDWFDEEILVPLLGWMEEQQKKREINISQEIMDSIHQDYDKDLNIELFASRLNYHPSYISRVFKKDTGITFTEYLTQYRIEVSKKWLKETDMKIADIAEKLCYSTASNFNRNFKKIVKVTPSQYREQSERQQTLDS